MKFRSFKPTGNASLDRAEIVRIIKEATATVNHCIDGGRLSPTLRDDKFRNRIENSFDIRVEPTHTTTYPVDQLADYIITERERLGL